ncbi:hypothetical protein AWW66_11140 [Micromonospora rosaria]|uniref:DUF4334 domain-containing protein n=1 Tax=Micromonospora rosaria TaxID=47874 RepID=A0A136PTY3_9ACTN|nr:DUF4334 domain-containing protein [Micromonospora rosaria]KXK61888.1 hypothetical protein AWW66_11140 [Micromonospora rosaria]
MTTRPGGPDVLGELRARPDLDATLAYYDTLPAVPVEGMLGRWRGTGLPTGHPMDGLLEQLGWYGKRFESAEVVHPLVFRTPGGGLTSVNPALLPVGTLMRQPALTRLPAADTLFRVLRPLLGTARPTARLRLTEYRGVVTATMCYDAHPIHDVFRRIDADRVLGAMDVRGSKHPYMFVLTRVRPAPDGGPGRRPGQ